MTTPMALTAGARIGPYEITGAIGAGGMGEVYRARDTRLNRDVAVKVLPELFLSDGERLARFEREAQVLASLNHPHIAQIYGLEAHGTTHALVMELVEGEDLAQRIARGPLPVSEAIAIATQIVDALEAAHERGIIHRDLKPANIKLRDDGTVKVLDFGLAKALDPASASAAQLMNSPTLTSPATMAGMIIGTAAYMAPEQAKGRAVDKRADIWAFGAVLFEMLAGRPPFDGDSTTEVLGAVVLKDPDWALLPSGTPLRVRELLRRCLEKDPRQRQRDIGDARFDLAAAHEVPTLAPGRPRRWRVVAFCALAALVASSATWLAMRDKAVPSPATKRFAVTGLTPLTFDPFQTLTLAPDGSALAFRGRGADGVDRIFIRSFATQELRSIDGTDGARMPFFSADGLWIGFFAGGHLKKVPIGGGSPQTIAPARNPSGGTWMDDGSIVFVGDIAAGVQRVTSTGGTPETVLTTSPEVSSPSSPWGLPGSDSVVLTVRQQSRFDLVALSLKDRKIRLLARDAYSPAWVPTGHVIFHQGNSLLALPFDRATLEAAGAAFPVASGVGTRLSFQSRLFAVAGDGTLVFSPQPTPGEAGWALMSVNRLGQQTRIAALDRPSDSPRLSPDGTRVAFRTPAPNCDVWVHDLQRGTTMRITREGDNHGIVWTRDSNRILVARVVSGSTEVVSLAADGTGDAQRLASFSFESGALPTSTAADLVLVQDRFSESTGMDIVSIPATGGQSAPVVKSPSDEGGAVLSPDGKLLAYVSNESGRNDVYLRPYAEQGQRVQVSTAGGTEPVWSAKGDELFFRNGRDLVSVSVVKGKPARPQVLFSGDEAFGPGAIVANYDVTRDGKGFLTMTGRQWRQAEVVVVLNWFSDWKQLGSGAPGRGAH
jgi:eukaryotic-like serine/threonine-protein kinase